MSLAPPPISGEIYGDAKLLIQGINKHAGPEGYAVVTARSKKSKKDVDRLVYLRCDRGGKASLNSAGFGRRLHSGTRLMECPFSAVGKRNKEGGWYLGSHTKRGSQSYSYTLFSSSSFAKASHNSRRGRGRGRGGQRGERAVTPPPPAIQTNAGLFAAFHM